MQLQKAIYAMVATGASDQTIAAVCRAAYEDEFGSCVGSCVAKVEDEAEASALVGAPQTSAPEPDIDRTRRLARDRQIKWRNRKKAAAIGQIDMFPVSIATDNVTPVTVTLPINKRNSPAPPKENTSSLRSEVIGGGGTDAPVTALVSADSYRIADKVATLARLDPDPMATPPGWCGLPMQVQAWRADGATEDAIYAGVRAGMYGRDGPPATPNYFTKPIMRMVAQMNRPIAIPSAEATNGNNRRNASSRKGGGFTRIAARGYAASAADREGG